MSSLLPPLWIRMRRIIRVWSVLVSCCCEDKGSIVSHLLSIRSPATHPLSLHPLKSLYDGWMLLFSHHALCCQLTKERIYINLQHIESPGGQSDLTFSLIQLTQSVSDCRRPHHFIQLTYVQCCEYLRQSDCMFNPC